MKEWFFTEEEYLENSKQKSTEEKYNNAVELLHTYKSDDIKNAKILFDEIAEYKDSNLLSSNCNKMLCYIDNDDNFNNLCERITPDSTLEELKQIKEELQSIIGYKNSKELSNKCDLYISEINDKERKYKNIQNLIRSDSLTNLYIANNQLKNIKGYKDCDDLSVLVKNRISYFENVLAEQRKKKTKKILILLSSIVVTIALSIAIWAALPGCMIHDYSPAACMRPMICRKCDKTSGEALGHLLPNVTCDEYQRCKRCGIIVGGASGHIFSQATCDKPATCTVCGTTKGSALGHDWIMTSYDEPLKCTHCGEMKPLNTPANGEVIFRTKDAGYSTITIKNESDNCYVKLKDYYKNDVMGFFVRGNETATVNIPYGSYYIYFASGDEWYGKKYLFGDDTDYSMDDELQTFSYSSYDNTYTTLTYTLYLVNNGNFTPKDINASEF